MKWSKFNYIVTHTESDICILNTYTQNYRWFTLDEYDEIIQAIEHNDEVIDETLITDGFIVESSLDEIERIKTEAREHRKKDYLFLVIYTTMACNYRCSYCFEGDRLCNEHLTTEKADEIIEFAKRYCEHTGLKRIYIKWFGGEPLLNRSVITQITNALNSTGYTVRAKMYTNGRLLTKEIATELKELRVDDIYIPIDGLEKDYVRLKNCKKEDYRAVLKNIKDCEDIINIHILVNVTESNKKGIKKSIRLIKEEYKIKSDIKLSCIKSRTDEISTDDFIELEEWLNIGNKRCLKRKYTGCEAQFDYHVVINTRGDLYKCERLTNIEKYKIGNIENADIEQLIKNDTEWNTFRIVEECKQCIFLPICMNICHTDTCINGYKCNREYYKRFIFAMVSEN